MPEKFEEVLIHLHPSDEVAVARRTVKAGTEMVNGSRRVTAAKTIPAGHKISLASIDDGAPIRRYGQIIGFAQGGIAPGDHVHTHNLVCKDFSRDYTAGTDVKPIAPALTAKTFQGYARPGGKVGTRNYVAIISTVNCSASVSRYIKEHFRGEELRRDFPNVDGVIALTHKVGCGIPVGESLKLLERVTVGMAHHPNVSGYVMIGLGCEMNQVGLLRQNYQLDKVKPDECPPTFMTIQGTGGVRKSVEAGSSAVAKLLPKVNDVRRSVQPISRLILAE